MASKSERVIVWTAGVATAATYVTDAGQPPRPVLISGVDAEEARS
jgi:hypothetical protein